MQFTPPPVEGHGPRTDGSIGRVVSVTGSKAIVLLDGGARGSRMTQRPEMGTLLAIEEANSVALAIVSAMSVPVPAQGSNESEVWIAELGLVGELWKGRDGRTSSFNRGVTVYPSLGDRVRVASKAELELAFCGDTGNAVRVGFIRQDATIPAMVRVDDLLGKHFAILGTTGTGKSCTTALVLRAILQKNPAAHIILIDPHNEYATAFTEWAEVVSPRNMQLPYWLLNFEEIIEVLVGDPHERKLEVEILQELIPLAKARYGDGRDQRGGKGAGTARRNSSENGRFTVDSPVPYRMSDLTALIDERMGKLENKRDLTPYRQLKARIDTITHDARYGFMFGSLTVYDGMSQILGRIFRVPVNSKPITVVELTGLPTEVVNVVVSVLCRLTFDFALFGEGQVPVTLVCEEAHRYVPANSAAGFEPCKRAIAKIAKEGRKYGASLCMVTQRPAEIDPTILSQCNTVFALRMSNDRDQEIVQSAVSDTGSGLLEFLPALGQREAIAFGDGVSLPVRIRFDELPKNALPRSGTARFSEKWQKSTNDVEFLDTVVERWRQSGAGSSGGDMQQQLAAFADAMSFGDEPPAPREPATPVRFQTNGSGQSPAAPRPAMRRPEGQPMPARTVRRDAVPAEMAAAPRAAAPVRREPELVAAAPVAVEAPPAAPAPAPAPAAASGFKTLRDRLLRTGTSR